VVLTVIVDIYILSFKIGEQLINLGFLIHKNCIISARLSDVDVAVNVNIVKFSKEARIFEIDLKAGLKSCPQFTTPHLQLKIEEFVIYIFRNRGMF